jgi:hypothetical protein
VIAERAPKGHYTIDYYTRYVRFSLSGVEIGELPRDQAQPEQQGGGEGAGGEEPN